MDISREPRLTKRIRFSEARLQDESSRNMYSEQGLEALMRSVFFDVCQRLMVVSNCMPGSPHCQVASDRERMSSRARYFLTFSLLTMDLVHQSLSSMTACM